MQLLKKILIGSNLAIGLNCFSFYKMEGVYWHTIGDRCWASTQDFLMKQPPIYNNDINIYHLSELKESEKDRVVTYFMYDKKMQLKFNETSSKLYGHTLPSLDDRRINLLNCNFIYDVNFFNNKNDSEEDAWKTDYCKDILGYQKEKLLFKQNGCIEKQFDVYLPSRISLQRKLCSISKIKIINEVDGVKLSLKNNKGNSLKEVNLTLALKNYFVESIANSEFANILGESYNGDGSYSHKSIEPGLNRLKIQSFSKRALDKKDYDLLQNSTILAIWTLIPQQKKDANGIIQKIESEMIGLARDEKTKEMYHWTTDLGQDISVLINYENNL